MTEKYTPKTGDRVRVVYEGEVISASNVVGFSIQSGDEEVPILWTDKAVSVEKIEPAVTVFKPGDVVRAYTEGPDDFYIIGKRGYLELPSGRFYADGPDTYKAFTSDHYEKVSLG